MACLAFANVLAVISDDGDAGHDTVTVLDIHSSLLAEAVDEISGDGGRRVEVLIHIYHRGELKMLTVHGIP